MKSLLPAVVQRPSPDWYKQAFDVNAIPMAPTPLEPLKLATEQFALMKDARKYSGELWLHARSSYRRLKAGGDHVRVRFHGRRGYALLCGTEDNPDSGVSITFLYPGEHEVMLTMVFGDLTAREWTAPLILDENYNRVQ